MKMITKIKANSSLIVAGLALAGIITAITIAVIASISTTSEILYLR